MHGGCFLDAERVMDSVEVSFSENHLGIIDGIEDEMETKRVVVVLADGAEAIYTQGRRVEDGFDSMNIYGKDPSGQVCNSASIPRSDY